MLKLTKKIEGNFMKHILLLMGLCVTFSASAMDQNLYNTLGQIVYVEHDMGRDWVIADDIHCYSEKNEMQCRYKEGTKQRSVEGELAQQLVTALQPFLSLDAAEKDNVQQATVKMAKCLKQQTKNNFGEPVGDYQYQCFIEK